MMRNRKMLDALFPKTRQDILAAFLLSPERRWYLSDLALHLHTRPSSLQRELAALTEVGLLQRDQDGNRIYYQVQENFPLLPELRGLFLKTAGLADQLRAALEPFLSGLESAFIYGSLARDAREANSDVDLMLIGDLRLADLTPTLRELERGLSISVDVTLYSSEEFRNKVVHGNHFLNTVLQGRKIFLKGSDHELADIVERQARENPCYQPSGVG